MAVALVALALVPFVQELTAQPAVRYAQTAALVEQQTVELDDYPVGVDRVERDGHVYGDKAPLQPILAAPVYALAKAVGAESATHLRVQGNLGLWWVTLWTTVVPLLAITALGVTIGSRLIGEKQAALATVALVLGTLLTAYGTQLYAHVLAGLAGWLCWLLLADDRGSARRAVLAGAAGGAAVAIEYPMMIVVVVCAAVLVQRRAWPRLAAFVAGGVPFVGVLLGYQWLAYGSPFTVSYGEKPVHDSEPLVVGVPNPMRLIEVLAGSRGIFIFTPVVVLALWGLWRSATRSSGEMRMHGIVGLVVFGAFTLMQAGWSNPWGGESPGPRYLVPALPFLIVGLAAVWDGAGSLRLGPLRIRPLVVGWSIFAMATTVVADHLVPGDNATVVHHLRWLRNHGPVDTLWTMAIGPAGWMLHAATVVACTALLWRSLSGRAASVG